MNEIAEELIKWDIHITAVQETRWNGSGWIDKKDYTLLYSVETQKKGKNGTGFIVLKKVRSCIMGFELVTEFQE
jgi:hypothetical protein